MDDEFLRFPIGDFRKKDSYTDFEVTDNLNHIAGAHLLYRAATENISVEQLDQTYRAGAWTVRQLVHHVTDIQVLHYFRMKKAVTELDYSTATLINIGGWVQTPDVNVTSIEAPLDLLLGINSVYVALASGLSLAEMSKSYMHPVRLTVFDQRQALAISAWHLQHHLAHIRLALGNF